MKVNEFILRISGSATLEKELEIDKNYSILIDESECNKITDSSNSDGSCNRIFTLKLISGINIVKEGEIIRAEAKKKSMSQILRFQLQKLWDAGIKDEEEIFQKFYEQRIQSFIDDSVKELDDFIN